MHFLKCRIKKFYCVLVLITLISSFLIFLVSKFSLNKLFEIQNQQKQSREKNKIPQIVGHYMGPGVNLNISQAFLNTNNYDPIPGEGEMGNPVVIPSKDLLLMQQLFQINRFNLLASDRISVNRSLSDVRNNV